MKTFIFINFCKHKDINEYFMFITMLSYYIINYPNIENSFYFALQLN